ncbi:MAG: hypothetical protein OXC19_04770 [Bryobacterales bacterium]|nr:hypothetical protein [Bryobacterales bacterium]
MYKHRFLRLTLGVALLGVPITSLGQSSDLADAITRVLSWLDRGYQLVPETGQWGLAYGLFEEGERKVLRFDAIAGHSYRIAGAGDEDATDLDICVYDSDGDEVDCDASTDNIPVVEFTARRSGTFRAVMRLYKSDLGIAFAGMAVLRKTD